VWREQTRDASLNRKSPQPPHHHLSQRPTTTAAMPSLADDDPAREPIDAAEVFEV